MMIGGNNFMDNLFGKISVELVIKKDKASNSSVMDEFVEYKVLETDSRMIYTFPCRWEGFCNGTIIRLFKVFNEAMFVGLNFTTSDSQIIVTDFEGNAVDKYEITENERLVYKYVKKKLMIIKILDKDNNSFVVKKYKLDFKYPNPVRLVLDLYSDSEDSGLRVSDFIKMKDIR